MAVLACAIGVVLFVSGRADAATLLATISNTARVQWDSAAGSLVRLSNKVDIDVLAEDRPVVPMPTNLTFDSATGQIVSGVRITLLNADTNARATVYGRDGVSIFPSTIVSGESVTDSGGERYDMSNGQFLFPMLPPGNYKLLIEPPEPWIGPSVARPEDLARLVRPDNNPFVVLSASFGGLFTVTSLSPLALDVPLDRPDTPLELTKQVSRPGAEPGDALLYTITVRNVSAYPTVGQTIVSDIFPRGMRLFRDSVRVAGESVTADAAGDGRSMEVALPVLKPGESVALTYILEVLPDAPPGDALNLAQARTARGELSNIGKALVRINRSVIANQLTVIGRVIDASCEVDPRTAPGVPNVRVMLEDGSYAITDEDGRYHFDALKAGLHVVQIDEATLPEDRVAVDCARNTRSAGRATSRFVEGQNGTLKRVDFRVAPGANTAFGRAPAAPARPEVAEAGYAAGDRDWLAGQAPGVEWLFPEPDHNPRAPAVRVAIKHLPGQKVTLEADGKPVNSVSFEGTKTSANRQVAVSQWRAVPISKDGRTRLTASVTGADGKVQKLERIVHFTNMPARVSFLPERSVLVADGITRPVIAVRLTDRAGRPLHHGSVGDFELPAPYYPAVEADAQQARQLAGLERARPVWKVEGDDGVAYVELQPTTASGVVSMRFKFRDQQTVREQRLEAWLDPGERPWTVVGLASGTLAYNRLKGAMRSAKGDEDELNVDGRLALYAKGRVRGKWLMTLAYDSDKDNNERFAGLIDPRAYYTVYADRSERRFDTASIRKLYLRLERPQFYALFGDYVTGIDEPALARYMRAFNGVKAEYQGQKLSGMVYAADAPTRQARDDIQGNGTSGPYALSYRFLLANSERVMLEVRDRLRSNVVLETRILTRYIDYDIDYDAGTIRFKEPILSRTSMLDPQFIVVQYEVDGVARRVLNAGGRVRWQAVENKLQIAATAIHDGDEQRTTNLGGVDVRYRPGENTEIRAEMAVSDTSLKANAGQQAGLGGTSLAWQLEAEHRTKGIDVLAYARQQDSGFGVGQLRGAESGTRKIGVDGRVDLTEKLSVVGSAWNEYYLGTSNSRTAGRALAEYTLKSLRARAGLTFADDRFEDGRRLQSSIAQLGATKTFLGDRLEIDGQTEFALSGRTESVDFANRHRLGLRFAVTRDITLTGSYEIADGQRVDARTARIGFDLRPWTGGRIAATVNRQDIAEFGPRSFASFGLSQSLVVNKNLSVDLTLDSNRTLGGIDPADVLSPLQPVAAGGFIGGGTLTEDFTAVTAGATYRRELWTITGRGEYRQGQRGNRGGFTMGALRQIGEGSAAGASFSWFTAKGGPGVETSTTSFQASWAHRPADSRVSFLEKIELRIDSVTGAVAGAPGPIGIPLTLTGNARSVRAINSLTVNWLPGDRDDDLWLDRSEVSVFWGSRYVSDRYGQDDVKGWSNVLGADVRFDLNDTLDIGPSGTLRYSLGGKSLSWAAGLSLGVRPFENGWLSVGWNFTGFSDRDFEEARYTRSGPFITMRFKFDSTTLAGLGLIRR